MALNSVTFTGLVHSFCADIQAELVSPSGTRVPLISRPNTDDAGATGDSSNFNGNYVIEDSATGNLWIAALGGGTTYNIPSGSYFAQGLYDSTQVLIADLLDGESPTGDWDLVITDHKTADSGTLTGWSFSVDICG
jgi:subtilisin-like proprotein convertase family protein